MAPDDLQPMLTFRRVNDTCGRAGTREPLVPMRSGIYNVIVLRGGSCQRNNLERLSWTDSAQAKKFFKQNCLIHLNCLTPQFSCTLFMLFTFSAITHGSTALRSKSIIFLNTQVLQNIFYFKKSSRPLVIQNAIICCNVEFLLVFFCQYWCSCLTFRWVICIPGADVLSNMSEITAVSSVLSSQQREIHLKKKLQC